MLSLFPSISGELLSLSEIILLSGAALLLICEQSVLAARFHYSCLGM